MHICVCVIIVLIDCVSFIMLMAYYSKIIIIISILKDYVDK